MCHSGSMQTTPWNPNPQRVGRDAEEGGRDDAFIGLGLWSARVARIARLRCALAAE